MKVARYCVPLARHHIIWPPDWSLLVRSELKTKMEGEVHEDDDVILIVKVRFPPPACTFVDLFADTGSDACRRRNWNLITPNMQEGILGSNWSRVGASSSPTLTGIPSPETYSEAKNIRSRRLHANALSEKRVTWMAWMQHPWEHPCLWCRARVSLCKRGAWARARACGHRSVGARLHPADALLFNSALDLFVLGEELWNLIFNNRFPPNFSKTKAVLKLFYVH